MKIVIASDHGGFYAKSEVIKFLISKGYEVIDKGCYSKERANYAQYAIKAAEDIKNGYATFGILICSSGEGVCIAANKVKGIRCGIGYNDEVSHLLREHNDANMIAFGANFMDIEDIKRRIIIFLNSQFEGDRHIERVDTIKNYEN